METLCQLDEIHYVEFYVEDQPLMLSGNAVGPMSADDFVQNLDALGKEQSRQVTLYLSTHYKESPKSCIPIPHKVVFSSPDSSLFISCSISHLPFPQDLNSAPILNGTNSSPRTAPVPHHQW